MEITDVEAITLHYPVDEPLYHGLGSFTSRSTVVVKLRTDDGLTGIGEAAFFAGTSGSTAAIIENELSDLVVGENPLSPERIWEKMYTNTYWYGRRGVVICAMSGIDIAVWDLMGKALDVPIHRLLGGFTDRIRPYASAGYYVDGGTPDSLATNMAEFVDDGFTAVKLKTGGAPGRTPEIPDRYAPPDRAPGRTDIERVAAVRDAVGDDVEIMIDSNNAWDVKTTLRMADALAEYDLYFIEEPIPTDDRRGLRRVATATRTPIAGCETAYTRYEFRDLIEEECVDVVQPGMNWAGGFTEITRIAALAAAHDLPVIPNSFHSGIDLAAAIHLTCGIPNGTFVEYDKTSANAFTTQLLETTFVPDADGFISAPDAPGLGVELNEEFIDRTAV